MQKTLNHYYKIDKSYYINFFFYVVTKANNKQKTQNKLYLQIKLS